MDLARREDSGFLVRCDDVSLPSLFCLGLFASDRFALSSRFRPECGFGVFAVLVLLSGVVAELGKNGLPWLPGLPGPRALRGVTSRLAETSVEDAVFVASDSLCCLPLSSLIAALMFIGAPPAPPYRVVKARPGEDVDNGVNRPPRSLASVASFLGVDGGENVPFCSEPGDPRRGVGGGDFAGGAVLALAESFSGVTCRGVVDAADVLVVLAVVAGAVVEADVTDAVVSGAANTGIDKRRGLRSATVPGGVGV
jgi:hypothetical protein